MLTYRTGAAGTPSGALAMAMHLLEQTLPRTQAELALYYQRGLTPALGTDGRSNPHEFTVAEPRRDMDPRLAALLGLTPHQVPSPAEIAQLLAGNRADGAAIPGKQIQRETRSLADELGLDASRAPKPDEIARVLAGCRADDSEGLPEARTGILQSRFLALYGAGESPDGAVPALSPEALAHIRGGPPGQWHGQPAGTAAGGAERHTGAHWLCRSVLVGGQIGEPGLGDGADRGGAQYHCTSA